MERLNSFISALESQHETFKTEGVNIKSLVKNIEFYESYIPDFFSKNGEAAGIRNMYKAIRESMDCEKSVVCANIDCSANIYREYMEGMINFIFDISDATFTESCDELKAYESKFEKAKTKDSLFIESLYGGKLNEKKEMVLSEAVANIEFLIDFIPELQTMKKQCKTLYESTKRETNEAKRTLLDESLVMLYESVENYCYSTISNIVDIYTDINTTLFDTKVKQQLAPSDTQFRLF